MEDRSRQEPAEPESAYEAFGKRYFILPNPMYGSWQQVPAR